MHLLGQILTALLGELGEHQTDDAAIVLGVDAQIGGLDGLLNVLEQLGVPGLNDQGTGVGGGNGGDAVQGRFTAIVFHGDPIENLCVGAAGADGGEFLVQMLESLVHSPGIFFEIDGHFVFLLRNDFLR